MSRLTTLRARLSAALATEAHAGPQAVPDAAQGTPPTLRAVPGPLDALRHASRERLRDCAKELDVSETAALAVAVRELHQRLLADAAETL